MLAKNYIWLSGVLILLAGLAGCEQIVTNIDFPETEPKVVVHSFISPADTATQVLLSWSVPVRAGAYRDSIQFIENGLVRIAREGDAFETLAFHPEKKVYFISSDRFPIEAGHHYQLRAEVPGHATVSARCYVPYANPSLSFESLERDDQGWGESFTITYSFTDISGEAENFYAPSAWLGERFYVFEDDTVNTGKQRFQTISGESYLSNKGREGRRFIQTAQVYDFNRMPGSPGMITQDTIFLLLLTTDEHYYRYHRDLESYFPDSPFAEPVHIYSNVKGGLGVFAGFSRYELAVAPL